MIRNFAHHVCVGLLLPSFLSLSASSLPAEQPVEQLTTIYVAPKKSTAYQQALRRADQENKVYNKFHKALVTATIIANQGGEQTVRILVAGGTYHGNIGQGTWELPPLKNPRASLELLGGYDSAFENRNPFENPVKLATTANRTASLISFGKKSQADRIVISGFVFDGAAGNAYDPETKSLRRSSSRTYPLLSLNNMLLNHLVVADNVFVNGPHGAFDPKVIPASDRVIVDIENNFFVNNIKPMKVGAGLSYRGNTIKQINVRNNSFLLNWPYNLDVTSANIGAIELQTRESAQSLNFEGNLFAFNVSGAFQHNWTPERMPEVTIRKNLFFRNADLFDKTDPDAGVMIGKFGLNPTYVHLGLEDIGDELEYAVEENHAFNPGIRFEPLSDQTPETAADPETTSDQQPDAAEQFLQQLEDEEWEDDVEFTYDGSEPGSNAKAGSVNLSGFAPKLIWDSQQPVLPKNQKASHFGVQINRVWSKQ